MSLPFGDTNASDSFTANEALTVGQLNASSNVQFMDASGNTMLTIVDDGTSAHLDVNCRLIGEACVCGVPGDLIRVSCSMLQFPGLEASVTPAPHPVLSWLCLAVAMVSVFKIGRALRKVG